MIIRSDHDDRWTIIRQVDHADISSQLANRWGNESFAAVVNEETSNAIIHHDDGWRKWDERLHFREDQLDPIAFHEMSWSDARPIWEDSIATTRRLGPLAAYITASHFLILSESGGEWSDDEAQFNAEYSATANLWLDEWMRISNEPDARATAERALQQLRFFDYLSIWLCLTEREEQTRFTTPDSIDVAVIPIRSNLQSLHQTFRCDPWPWSVSAFEVYAKAFTIGKSVRRRPITIETCDDICIKWRFSTER